MFVFVPRDAFIWASAHRLNVVCVPDAYIARAGAYPFVADIFLRFVHTQRLHKDGPTRMYCRNSDGTDDTVGIALQRSFVCETG